MREAGVEYKVYKNTMMKRAFAGTDCEELSQHLEGTNAIAISTTDATAPARILAKYAKQSPITNFARVLNQIAEANGGAAETEAAAE